MYVLFWAGKGMFIFLEKEKSRKKCDIKSNSGPGERVYVKI
jgi:hypothetical protein